jgi:hypothetical protein
MSTPGRIEREMGEKEPDGREGAGWERRSRIEEEQDEGLITLCKRHFVWKLQEGTRVDVGH